MSTQIEVNKLDNGYGSAIKTIKAGNAFICRLANWSLIFVKMNKVGTDFTIVYYDPLNADYHVQNINKSTFHAVYEEMYKPVVSECFEIIGTGKIETVDEIERIMTVLPIPDEGPDHKKFRRFLDSKKLNFPSRQASFILFPRVKKEDSRDIDEKSLAGAVIELLGDFVKQYVVYGENEITIEVQDVNAKLMDKDRINYIKDVLESNGFMSEKVGFNFGDGHWLTLYIRK